MGNTCVCANSDETSNSNTASYNIDDDGMITKIYDDDECSAEQVCMGCIFLFQIIECFV